MNITEMKEKFKYDLIGRWSSCVVTFSVIMNEIWEFNSNGTGRIISYSALSGTDTEEFKWRRKGPFCIETTIFCEEDEPEIWVEKCYDFSEVETDSGVIAALIELDRDTKEPRKGFGLMNDPLMYLEEIEE